MEIQTEWIRCHPTLCSRKMIRALLQLIFLTTIFGCAATSKHGDHKASLDALRGKSINFSDNGSGMEAYANLMKSGESGFEVLTDAWAYYKIPEERWIQWQHDFSLRYFLPTDQTRYEIIDQYDRYLDDRLLNEPAFYDAAVERNTSEIGYQKIPVALVVWLDPSNDEEIGNLRGHRMLAHDSLKEIYGELPNYDLDASAEIRSKQYEKIVVHLEAYEQEKPSLPNDPFSN